MENEKIVGGIFFNYLTQNQSASEAFCTDLWKKLVDPIVQKIQSNGFKSIEDYQKEISAIGEYYMKQAKGPAKLILAVQFKQDLEKERTILIAQLNLSEEMKKQLKQEEEYKQQNLMHQQALNDLQLKEKFANDRLKQLEVEQSSLQQKWKEERVGFETEMKRNQAAYEKKLQKAKDAGDKALEDVLKTNREQIEIMQNKFITEIQKMKDQAEKEAKEDRKRWDEQLKEIKRRERNERKETSSQNNQQCGPLPYIYSGYWINPVTGLPVYF